MADHPTELSQDRAPLLSVWSTGQHGRTEQLRGRGYTPGTQTDTDLIPPAIVAHAITTYTRPGDLVVDPDCGAGTVLVEALRAGRHALGLTNSRWWTIARANITAAKKAGAWRDGSVLDAPPEMLATVHAAGLVGRVGLLLTTLRTAPDERASGPVVIDELAATLAYSEPLVRAAGHVVVVVRPRRHGALVDLTTKLIAAAMSAGLVPVERCIALTAGLRGSRLITRASLAERRVAARARASGTPIALTTHHEVLVFQVAQDAELAAAAANIPQSAVQGRRAA